MLLRRSANIVYGRNQVHRGDVRSGERPAERLRAGGDPGVIRHEVRLEVLPGHAHPRQGHLHVCPGNRVRGKPAEVGSVGLAEAAVGIRDRESSALGCHQDVRRDRAVRLARGTRSELRQLCPHRAGVSRLAAGARAALQRQPPLQPRGDGDIKALPVLRLVAEILERLRELVHLTDLRRHEVVKATDRVAPAARQPRIDRCLDAEWRVVLEAGGPVVHNVPVAPRVAWTVVTRWRSRDAGMKCILLERVRAIYV